MHPAKTFIIKTSRLHLRLLDQSHINDLQMLLNDSDVIAQTEDNYTKTVAQVKQIIELNNKLFKQYKFCKWAVCLNNTGAFIGWCGFKYYEKINKISLSYSILKQYRSKGYATEASEFAINYFFQNLQINEVVAWSTPNNEPSVKVLSKLGFRFIQIQKWGQINWNYYKIDRNEFNSRLN